MERDRAFYPLVTIVTASYYALFAAIGDSTLTVMWELIPISLFVLTAIFGFKQSLWWIVAALLAQGVFDIFHEALIRNAGVPARWPMFCLSFGVVAAGYLTWRLKTAGSGEALYSQPYHSPT